jgi:hypothetical protein
VAVVGSVLSSAYSSHLLSALTRLGVPARAASEAGQSMAAGLAAAGHLPPGLRGLAMAAARQAFMSGLHDGSVVAAGATAGAALMALVFLPARARAQSAAAQPAPASASASGEGAPAAELDAARR